MSKINEPPPDPSRVLKVLIEERTKNCVGANYGSVKENLEWLVAKATSIKDAEHNKMMTDFVSLQEHDEIMAQAKLGMSATIELAKREHQARIEALIEPLKYLTDRCTEVMEGYNQGLTPDKVDWAGIVGEADKRARKALATHTSKGGKIEQSKSSG